MEELVESFSDACREIKIDSQNSILETLKRLAACHNDAFGKEDGVPASYCLDLSLQSLSTKICQALGKALSTDTYLKELRLSDCMLPEDGLVAICSGLASNQNLKRLDLKGNNIKGSAVNGLASLLRTNHCIEWINLEWNTLGMLDNSFSVFCDGLALNKGLKMLDLRNNQISQNCGRALANAFQRNTTLKHVDLRWNCLGPAGGRSLLDSLKENKSLIFLNVSGNNIPTEVSHAIERVVIANADKEVMQEEFQSRSLMLCSEIKQKDVTHTTEVNELLEKIDGQQRSFGESTRKHADKISQLQVALDDRRAAFLALQAKLAESQAALNSSARKTLELEALIEHQKRHTEEIQSEHEKHLQRLREERADIEARLLRDVNDANEKRQQLLKEVQELGARYREQRESTGELEHQVASLQSDMTQKLADMHTLFELEHVKYREQQRLLEDQKNKEIQKLRRVTDDQVDELRSKIESLQHVKQDLEEEVASVKLSAKGERQRHEDELLQLKQRFRTLHEQKVKDLDEKCRAEVHKSEELSRANDRQDQVIDELQSRVSRLTVENQSLKNQVQDLSQTVSGHEKEKRSAVEIVRESLTRCQEKLDDQTRRNVALEEKITKLETRINGFQDESRQQTAQHAADLDRLKSSLVKKDEEIERMRTQHKQRATLLQKAFVDYIGDGS